MVENRITAKDRLAKLAASCESWRVEQFDYVEREVYKDDSCAICKNFPEFYSRNESMAREKKKRSVITRPGINDGLDF